MVTLKKVTHPQKNVDVELSISLDENGIRIISFIDTMELKQDEGSDTCFSFEEIKESLLDCYIVPNKGLTHEKSLKTGEYIIPKDDDASSEVISEITKMKEFFINLEAECLKNFK